MFRNIMILGFFSTLFGCGDGKPGFFSTNGYHVGSEKVWYKTMTGPSYNVIEVEGADPETFEVKDVPSKMFPKLFSTFGMDKNSVFWAGTKIEGVDLPSFEYVCSWYARDKNAVYCQTQRLTTDLANFSAVGNDFVKDSRYVYFGTDIFSEDAANFVRVGGEESGYFKDTHKCWYGIYELPEADPKTLRFLGPATAADKSHVYHEMNIVDDADIDTYQVLENSFSKDAKHVFHQYNLIEGADPKSFRVLADHYSMDNKHCYYFSSIIEGADPATYQRIDEFYAKDARHVFSLGEVIEGADPATFRVLNAQAGCSCDAKYAYCMRTRIQGVDPKTFPLSGQCKSCNETSVEF